MDQMRAMGFSGTLITYAKETVFSQESDAVRGVGDTIKSNSAQHQTCAALEEWRKGTLDTVAMLGDGDQLAVK